MRQTAPSPARRGPLIQWTGYLVGLAYWTLIGGVYYYSLKFPVAVVNWVLAGLLWAGWGLARARRGARLPWTGLEPAWIGLTLIQGVVTLTSSDPHLSLENLTAWLGFVLAFWVVADLLAQGWPEMQLLYGLFFAGGIVCLAGLWEVGSWYRAWWRLGILLPPTAYRLNGLLAHPNLTAGYLNWIVVLASLRLTQARRTEKIGLLGLLGACAVTIFFTASRGGWIALLCAEACAFGLFWGKQSLTRVRAWLNPLFRPRRLLLGAMMLLGVILAGWLFTRQSLNAAKAPLLESRSEYWPGALRLFQSHWLTGVGPGLFTRTWATVESLPPTPVVVHAHNTYLMLAVENGFLGLAAYLGLAVAFVAALRRRWRACPHQRWLLAAIAGGLVGLAVHGLADFLLNSLALGLNLAIIAALGLTPRPGEPPAPAGWRLIWIWPVGLLGWLAFGYWLWAYAPLAQGLRTQQSDILCQAEARDPASGFYAQQCGLALAAEPDHLTQAIAALERAVALDPNWPANYANLGALSAAAGRWEEAQTWWEQARQRAPRSALFALNAGWVYEQRGRTIEALATYQAALRLGTKPAAVFWTETPLRQTALRLWQTMHPATARDPAQLAPADRLMYYQTLLHTTPQHPTAYIGLAHWYWDQGDTAQGDAYARQAMSLQLFEPVRQLEVWWLEAEYAWRHHLGTTAIAAGKLYFSQIDNYTLQGPGTRGYANYAWFGFRRDGLPVDYVPQVQRADVTPEIEARRATLAEWESQP